jgi:hypothetical protein
MPHVDDPAVGEWDALAHDPDPRHGACRATASDLADQAMTGFGYQPAGGQRDAAWCRFALHIYATLVAIDAHPLPSSLAIEPIRRPAPPKVAVPPGVEGHRVGTRGPASTPRWAPPCPRGRGSHR